MRSSTKHWLRRLYDKIRKEVIILWQYRGQQNSQQIRGRHGCEVNWSRQKAKFWDHMSIQICKPQLRKGSLRVICLSYFYIIIPAGLKKMSDAEAGISSKVVWLFVFAPSERDGEHKASAWNHNSPYFCQDVL